MSFPVDTSRVTLLGCDYVNITKEEISTEEARQYVEDGIMFAKIYFQNKDVKGLFPGAEAIALSKPVLFRDASGDGQGDRIRGRGAGGKCPPPCRAARIEKTHLEDRELCIFQPP